MTFTGSCLLYFPFSCLCHSFPPGVCDVSILHVQAPQKMSFIVQCFSKSNVHQLRISVKWTFLIWKVWGGTEDSARWYWCCLYKESCFHDQGCSQRSEKGSATGWSSWNNALRLLHHRLTRHQSALSQVIGLCGTNHGTLGIKIPMALEVAVYRIWYKQMLMFY